MLHSSSFRELFSIRRCLVKFCQLELSKFEIKDNSSRNVACLLVPQLSELYAEDYIFDRFSCCASKDGSYFATGSYRFSLLKRMDSLYWSRLPFLVIFSSFLIVMISSNTFKVFTRTASQTTGTTLEASANPYRYNASNISGFVSPRSKTTIWSDVYP
jgi:hypothetical protein